MSNSFEAIENLNISPYSAHKIICEMQKAFKNVHEFIHSKIQPHSQGLDCIDTARQTAFPIYKVIKYNLDSIGLKEYQQIRAIAASLTDSNMQKNKLYDNPSFIDDSLMKKVRRIYHGKTKSSKSIPDNVYSTIADLYKARSIKLNLANLPNIDFHIARAQNEKKPKVLLDHILLNIINGNSLNGDDNSGIYQLLSKNSKEIEQIICDTISSYDQELAICAMICGAKESFFPSNIYDYIFCGMIPLMEHLNYAEAKCSIKTLFDHFDTFKALTHDEIAFLRYCISLPDDFSLKILNTYKLSILELFANTPSKEWNSIQNEIVHYTQDTPADFENKYKSSCKFWENIIQNSTNFSIISAIFLWGWIITLYYTPLSQNSLQLFVIYMSFPSKRSDLIDHINSCVRELHNI